MDSSKPPLDYSIIALYLFLQEPSGELDANLLCSDGTISRLERGGRAVCSVVSTTGGAVYSVYA